VSGEEVRRRWRTLDDEQRLLAEELVTRALELRELSEGELGVREALELAADAMQRRRETRARAAAAAPAVPVESDSPAVRPES
jgi:hypothetical protein